jgi:hypothetical protein
VVFTAGTEFTTIVKACSSKSPAESVTRTVKLDTPVTVGVPEIFPVLLFNSSPSGNAPAAIDQFKGGVPANVESVWPYAIPIVAPGSVVVVMVKPALIAMDNA